MSDHPVRTYPCPACLAQADLVRGCSGCGRPPDPLAAEVVELNTTIALLREREQRCQADLAAIRQELAKATARRDSLAAQVRVRRALGTPAQVPATAAVPPGPPVTGYQQPTVPPAAAVPQQPAAVAAGGEVSSYGVQTLLFVIGGLLLGTGAVVFMVVAWTRFGLLGQALTLLLATAIALAAPPLARWRRLPGTAETMAVIAVLMLLLDGYATWRGGLVGQLPASGWAGVVCGATALIALGYGRWVTLTSTRFAALVLAQPVLPLLAAEPLRGASDDIYLLAAVGYLLVAVAGGNLLLCWRLPGGALRVLGWIAAGVALVAGAGVALLALTAADRPVPAAVAGGAVATAVAACALVARASRVAAWWAVTAAGGVLTVVLVVGKLVALIWAGYAVLAAVATVALLALAGRGLGSGPLRRGHRIGGLVATGGLGAYGAVLAVWAAAVAAWQAPQRPSRLDVAGPYDWQLLAALLLLAVALLALLPSARRAAVTATLALAAFTLPAALALPWWTPVVAALVAAAGIAAPAARAATGARAYPAAVVAAILAGYAVLVGRASATALAAALGAVMVIGLAVAALARRGGSAGPDATQLAGGPAADQQAAGTADEQAGEQAGDAAAVRPVVPRHRALVGRAGLLIGLLALPGAAAALATAVGAGDPWPGRTALVATVLLLVAAALLGRTAACYLPTAAAAVHVVTPIAVLVGLIEGGMAVAGYAGGSLLLLALLGLIRRPADAGLWLLPRAPLAGLLALVTLPSLLVILLLPYGWLGHIWSGRPERTGLLPPGTSPPRWSVLDPAISGAPLAAGLLLLLVAAAVAGRVVAGRWSAAGPVLLLVAPVPLLTGLAWLTAPWPIIPATSLLLGGAAAGGAALRGRSAWWAPVGAGYGLALAGVGLAGLLPMSWTTLAGLGFVLVVAAAVAGAGRRVPVRAAGWVVAAGAGVLLAVAAARAATAPAAVGGFAVLAVAALVLVLSTLMPAGRVERAAGEASAHGAAVVALLLLLSSPALAAVAAVLWGVALGLRALRTPAGGGRLVRLVAAGASHLLAWWLLLVSVEVGVVEAYTLPAALLALGLGAWVRRSRPQVSSWLAYGVGLAAALLPSLALSLADPAPLRRLLLGAGAVAVLVLGARARLQAPVIAGGLIAAVLAVRELALVWQRLDAWIPLTVAGLLLVGLAATYERRRRDLIRLRAALRQLS